MPAIKLREKFQSLVNHLLQQDPAALNKVRSMRGKIVAVEVEGPAITTIVQFSEQCVHLLDEYAGEPHVTISARPLTFVSVLLKRAGPGRMPAEMKIHGDVGLAQDFQQLVNDLDIDWEEQVSHWTGDTAARQLGRLYRTLHNYLGEAGQTAIMNFSEYLLYEREIVPPRDEVNAFIEAVNTLRNDSERLIQRVGKLEKQITGIGS